MSEPDKDRDGPRKPGKQEKKNASFGRFLLEILCAMMIGYLLVSFFG